VVQTKKESKKLGNSMMDQREFAIETPIGSVRSDSENHGLDVLSVLGVVCILYVGRILMKKIIKRFIG